MSEEAINAFARDKHFSSQTLERWLRCTTTDREALLRIAATLRLGENQFRDVFDQAREIAARHGSSVGQVLATQSVQEVLGRGLGRNETLRALKQALRRLRYPQLAAVEAGLADKVKALRLPLGVEVHFPDNLEGEEISVQVRAKSALQLRQRVDSLTAAMKRVEIDEIFSLLEGDW